MTKELLKYEPLQRHLEAVPGDTSAVTMAFEQIERVIGAPLPVSAWEHREWWSNQKDTADRPQAQAWLAAGFVVDFVRQTRGLGQVRFKRK